MNFLYAISGWQWALAAAVPLGIFALYFLKLKRQPLQVPSTFLWKKSIEDLHVNSLWQRLRKSLLLFLQLAIALLIIAALLRPTFDSTDQGDRLILLIDNSASMAATDVTPTRLEEAKAKAIDIVEKMEPGDAAMVIAFNDAARVASSYSQNATSLKDSINSIRQSAKSTNIQEAISIASGLANPQRAGEDDAEAVPATLYVLSDGNFSNVEDLALGNLTLEFLSIGLSDKNVAVVGMSARPSDVQPDRLDVFARLKNFSSEPIDVLAELKADGQVVDLQQATLDAEADQPMIFRLQSKESVQLALNLQVDDDFPLDNQAWSVVNPPRRVRVLVIGDDNPIIRASMQTGALAEMTRIDFENPVFIENADFSTLRAPAIGDISGEAADVDPGGPYDLVIFDRCSPPIMPECNTMFIDAAPPYLSATPRKKAEGPIILNWNASHPVLRFLELDDVNIASAFTMDLPRGADELIESDQGALLFAVPRGVYTDVVQTFALIDETGNWQTDWPLKASFPLYMMNVVRGLGGTEADRRQSIQAGESIALRGIGNADRAEIMSPDGTSSNLVRSPRGRFEFLDTEQLGIYEAKFGESMTNFAVNMFDETESKIAPQKEVQVGSVEATDTSSEFAARKELWKYLTAAAFAVLVLEWYIYNRRVYL